MRGEERREDKKKREAIKRNIDSEWIGHKKRKGARSSGNEETRGSGTGEDDTRRGKGKEGRGYEKIRRVFKKSNGEER